MPCAVVDARVYCARRRRPCTSSAASCEDPSEERERERESTASGRPVRTEETRGDRRGRTRAAAAAAAVYCIQNIVAAAVFSVPVFIGLKENLFRIAGQRLEG